MLIFPSDLKKTTVVVESLSSNTTKCSVPENISILQDYFNRMRNLHQIAVQSCSAVYRTDGYPIMQYTALSAVALENSTPAAG